VNFKMLYEWRTVELKGFVVRFLLGVSLLYQTILE
jgi:hypothetical protein